MGRGTKVSYVPVHVHCREDLVENDAFNFWHHSGQNGGCGNCDCGCITSVEILYNFGIQPTIGMFSRVPPNDFDETISSPVGGDDMQAYGHNL